MQQIQPSTAIQPHKSFVGHSRRSTIMHVNPALGLALLLIATLAFLSIADTKKTADDSRDASMQATAIQPSIHSSQTTDLSSQSSSYTEPPPDTQSTAQVSVDGKNIPVPNSSSSTTVINDDDSTTTVNVSNQSSTTHSSSTARSSSSLNISISSN